MTEKLEVLNLKASYTKDRTKFPRLYVWPEDETVFENLLAGRRSRPVELYRKLLPEILERFGLPEDTKATWSQKAGCSCGCSPGFILNHPLLERTSMVYHVTVTRAAVDDEIRKAVKEIQGKK